MDPVFWPEHYSVCKFREPQKPGLFILKDIEPGLNPNGNLVISGSCPDEPINAAFFSGNKTYNYQSDLPSCRATGQAVVIENSDSIVLLNIWGSSYCSEINLGEPNEKQFRFIMRITIKDGLFYMSGNDDKRLVKGIMSNDGKSLSFKNENILTIISVSE